jgi:hypothetical protein
LYQRPDIKEGLCSYIEKNINLNDNNEKEIIMKKIILAGLLILAMSLPCLASQAGIEIKKDVNGGYLWSTPVVMDTTANMPFLPKVYVTATPIFTSPRGDVFKLNHSRFDLAVGSGIKLLKGDLEFETGMTYWWAGNSQGIGEGAEWNNAVRYYWTW